MRPELLDLPITKHLKLADFVTHDDQDDVWPKYVALNPRLLDKLELVFADLGCARPAGAHGRRALGVPLAVAQSRGARARRATAAISTVTRRTSPIDANGDGRSR